MLLLAGATVLSAPAPASGAARETAEAGAPGHARVTDPDGVVRFPFDLYGGDIRFRCRVNGHDTYMLLDDGFMWDSLLLWGGPEVDSLGLVYDDEEVGVVGGATGDAEVVARTASGITVAFPGVEFTGQTAVVSPAASGNSAMWQGSIGQVSAMLFKHFVVAIDFDDRTIALFDPRTFSWDGSGAAVTWEPMGFGPWKIPATIGLAGRRVPLDLMMDLGYNDQLRIATGGEHNLSAPPGATPASLGVNIQGVETRGHRGYLDYVDIGGYEVRNVEAGFVLKEQADHTYHEAMVGLGLLSRFNLVFDYSRRTLFVEPNASFDDPFE
jgi:hypothetical protein